MPGRHVRDGKRRRCHQVGVVGDRNETVGIYRRLFGEAAVEEAVFLAQVLRPAPAVATRTAGLHRVEDDCVARLEVVDTSADLPDRTPDIDARDERGVILFQSEILFQVEGIVSVYRGTVDVEENLVGTDGRYVDSRDFDT